MMTEALVQELKEDGACHHAASTRLLNLLATAKTSQDAIASVLSFFQQLSGCEAAGVRIRDEDDFPLFKTLGFSSEFVEAETYLCARDVDGDVTKDSTANPILECMCGNILCGRFDASKPFFTSRGSFWTNSTSMLLKNTPQGDLLTKTRNRCSQEGYESVALIPLRHDESIVGLLLLNDRRQDRFTEEVLALIEALADGMTAAVLRRREEERLRKREEHCRAMVTAFHGLVYICTADYRIEFLNEAMKEHIGRDATGDLCYQALHGLDAVCPWCVNEIVFAGQNHRWVVQSPKDMRWYEVSNAPIWKKNKVIAKQAMIVDITERQRLHQELLEKQKALEEANDLLEVRVAERTSKLEAAIREQESFSYSVSHDLRAPLRHINSFSAILHEEFAHQLTPTAKTYLDRIRTASNRMGDLIDHLLELSRVGRAELKRLPINLSELAASVLGGLQETDPNRVVETFVAQDVRVLGDHELLRQLLENLLGNAWKYTSKTADAKIEFGTSMRGQTLVIYVKDNGAGFDMQYKDKLFVAFQRLHNSEFEGEGIGLKTVQRIVERHGGEIWAEGKVGGGATFSFSLPDWPGTS
ncbi:sensor histidine kinase [Geomonas anaerohicana]|uniref:histidine kinase n=1 Tax=Geomonas anaerohicana TaxID=2798583 RepID=A0ABS0YC46_9BACT|nr:ATP-binding protein [Geomonas anaerohicana]MBJ6749855.1 GHKL domain-containing protein [Geomonas anaerohicana]